MRHKMKGKKFGREAAPRKALMRGLATNFMLHGRMKTTVTKAKAIRPVVEKLITVGRKNDLSARRYLIQYLQTEEAVNKVLNEISPKYMDRKGGYTRITKIGPRKGDGAEEAVIELV
jgi:large subunit ribosomal protein L17